MCIFLFPDKHLKRKKVPRKHPVRARDSSMSSTSAVTDDRSNDFVGEFFRSASSFLESTTSNISGTLSNSDEASDMKVAPDGGKSSDTGDSSSRLQSRLARQPAGRLPPLSHPSTSKTGTLLDAKMSGISLDGPLDPGGISSSKTESHRAQQSSRGRFLPAAVRSKDISLGDYELSSTNITLGDQGGQTTTATKKSGPGISPNDDDDTNGFPSESSNSSKNTKVRAIYAATALLITLVVATIAALATGGGGGGTGGVAGACLFGLGCGDGGSGASSKSSASILTAGPSLHPSPLPTMGPTTADTCTVAVSFAITAAAAPTTAEEASLKTTVASEAGVLEGAVQDFSIAVTPSRRRLGRAQLDTGEEAVPRPSGEAPRAAATSGATLNSKQRNLEREREQHLRRLSVTWDLSFSVVASLADVGAPTRAAFAASLGTAFNSAPFATSVASAFPGAAVDGSSIVAVVAATRRPSFAPAPLPSSLDPSGAPHPSPSPVPPRPAVSHALKFASQAAPAADSNYEIEVFFGSH